VKREKPEFVPLHCITENANLPEMSTRRSELAALRAQLTNQARAIVNAAWQYYLEKGTWIPSTRLQHQVGKEAGLSGLKSLNGCVIVEERGAEGNYCYLTLLGMLITDKGKDLEDTLAAYLSLIKRKLESGLETKEITLDREQVETFLNISSFELQTFYRFIRFSPFTSGGGGSGSDWQVGVPYYLDDLLLENDLHHYIQNRAFKDYDPDLPSSYTERMVYLGSKRGESERKQDLMTRLAALVENHQGLHGASEFLQSEGVDWTEADQTYVTNLEAWLSTVDSVLDLAGRSLEVEIWRRQREKNGPVTLLNVHDTAERMRVVLEGIMARIAGTRMAAIADSGISSPGSRASRVREYDKDNSLDYGSLLMPTSSRKAQNWNDASENTPPSQIGPVKILNLAIAKVPAVKYALGVAGIGAAIAIIRILLVDLRIAVFGTVLMIFLMIILLLFAKLTAIATEQLRPAMITLIWVSLLLLVATAFALFTSVFFRWPVDLQYLILNRLPAAAQQGTEKTPEHEETYLRGLVVDRENNPVPGARVTIDELPAQDFTTTTDGGFSIEKIPRGAGDRARIYVQKNGYENHNEYVVLPGPVRVHLVKSR
jgi:hypothetical protein